MKVDQTRCLKDLGPATIDLAIIQCGDSGRIVATVRKPREALEKERCNRLRAYNSNDSTHVLKSNRQRRDSDI